MTKVGETTITAVPATKAPGDDVATGPGIVGGEKAAVAAGVAAVELPVKRERWSSRWTFIIASVGGAVGLGNVWRFPFLMYKHGGGTFLIPYAIFLVCIGLPLMQTELALGTSPSDDGRPMDSAAAGACRTATLLRSIRVLPVRSSARCLCARLQCTAAVPTYPRPCQMFCTRHDHIREYMQHVHRCVRCTLPSMYAPSRCRAHGGHRGHTHALHACFQHSFVAICGVWKAG